MEDDKAIDRTLVRNISPLQLKYTDVDKLSLFVSETGKILPRKFSGLSAHHQRIVAKLIKRARNMLLMK